MQWNEFASDPEVFDNIPTPREYSYTCYDKRDRRLLMYGGWNNGWYGDLYTLNVSKIIGPPYAITGSEPDMSQLTGGVKVRVFGRGFKEFGPRVLFTCGNKPIDNAGRMTKEGTNTRFISETEIECMTPHFGDFAPNFKEAVMQVQLGTDDITTTWIPFSYFLNTRAKNSLCYGPGVLEGALAGTPVEFVIQARNEQDENRTSGRDSFEVRVVRKVPIKDEPKSVAPAEEGGQPAPPKEEEKEAVEEVQKFEEIELPTKITDNEDGTYTVKYTSDQVGEVFIYVSFLDDKGKMVPVRGEYKAIFVDDAKPADNTMLGGVMERYIKKETEKMTTQLADTKREVNPKDKDLKNVKVLLRVKENVEATQTNIDSITLQIDQLEEALRLFHGKKLVKDAQIKTLTKIKKEWIDVKKITKDANKEITPYVASEADRNQVNIKKLEEEISQFTGDMRKREFF
jgi:dynein heavy chain